MVFMGFINQQTSLGGPSCSFFPTYHDITFISLAQVPFGELEDIPFGNKQRGSTGSGSTGAIRVTHCSVGIPNL
jgi:hypothetical protein